MMTGEKGKKKGSCKYLMHGGKLCGRSLHDENLCVFHSKDIEGKKNGYNKAFWAEFKRQKDNEETYDFTGFIFPSPISFEEKKFEKKAIFLSSRFSENAYFKEAQFSGDVNFEAAIFKGEADFERVEFTKNAKFYKSKFFGKADFMLSKFYGEAIFAEVRFSGYADFRETRFFGWANFIQTKFLGDTKFWGTRFSDEVNFSEITINNVNKFSMQNTTLYDVDGLFEFIEANKKKFKYSNKTEFLPDNFSLILGEEAMARYPIFSRKIKDDMYLLKFKKRHPKLHFIWWLFADCGRSILRWALWSLGLSLFFGLLWLILGGNFFYFNPEKNITWLSYFYYSFVTFTTLGFGDIVPTNWISETLVTIEVILGYIMLGGLISILANKLARRS
jgi:hypothetical protein